MSDKGLIMYDAVTEIRDDIVEQAADYKFRRSPIRFIKPLSIAASVCLVGGAAVFAVSALSGTGGIPVANSVTEAAGNATVTAASEIVAGYVTTASETSADTAFSEETSDSVIATYDPDGYPSAADVPAYGPVTESTTAVPQAVVTEDTTLPAVTADTTLPAVTAATTLPAVSGLDGDDAADIIYDDENDDENPGGGAGMWFLRGYDPPVMPLTAGSDTSGITAERELTFDLTDTQIYADLNDAWKMGEYGRMSTVDEVGIIEVSDSYTLTNTTDVDKTISLMYPFESGLDFLEGDPFASTDYIGTKIPTVTIDGKAAKPGLIAGDFSGYFSSASYPAKDDKSNLDEYYSAEDYLTLLGDGSYLKEALEAPKTIGEKVVVYHIYDCGTTYDTVANDTFVTAKASFTLGEGAEANVIGYDRSFGRTGNKIEAEFKINNRGEDSDPDIYITVRGGDIENLKLQGYYHDKNNNWNRTETDEIYYKVERTEKNIDDDLLNQFITELSADGNLRGAYESYKNGVLTDDVIYNAVMKYICKYGEYSDKPIERYLIFGDMASQIDDAVVCERIMYATFDVTIPAGGSVTVNARHRRYADMNVLDEAGHADYGLYMFTTLGSTLNITSQTVDVIGLPDVDITEGNMGTDVTDGKLHTDIDSKEKVYYLRFVPKK
jgi:hypothetical protein